MQYTLTERPLYETALDRLRQYEPPEGYYLAFSGGKDSIVIYDLAKRAGVTFDAHFHLTTVDPPELIRFVRENYPDVIWERPKMSMFQLIRKKKMLPTRMKRFCCSGLKEFGGKGRIVVIGIRWDESPHRRDRGVFERSRRDATKYFLSPIIDWTEQDVWDYIHERKLKYCELYDLGYKRIGCILCPLQTIDGKLMDIERYPKFYKAYLRAVKHIFKEKSFDWESPEEMMEWWVYNGETRKGQTVLSIL